MVESSLLNQRKTNSWSGLKTLKIDFSNECWSKYGNVVLQIALSGSNSKKKNEENVFVWKYVFSCTAGFFKVVLITLRYVTNIIYSEILEDVYIRRYFYFCFYFYFILLNCNKFYAIERWKVIISVKLQIRGIYLYMRKSMFSIFGPNYKKVQKTSFH